MPVMACNKFNIPVIVTSCEQRHLQLDARRLLYHGTPGLRMYTTIFRKPHSPALSGSSIGGTANYVYRLKNPYEGRYSLVMKQEDRRM